MGLSTLLVAPWARTSRRTDSSGGSKSSAYVGMDRRRGLVSVEHVSVRTVVMPAAVLAAASITALVLAVLDVRLPSALDPSGLTRLIEMSTAVVGTVVVMLAFVRWRLTGEATPLWVGTAVAVVTVFVTGLSTLVPVVIPDAADMAMLDLLPAAGGIVAMAVLAVAAFAPEVDSRLRPFVMVTVVSGAASAASAALFFVPGASDALRSVGGSVLLAVGWLLAAGLMAWATLARQRRDLAPVAAMAVGFGLARIVVVATDGVEAAASSMPGPALLRLLALAALLVGARRSLEDAFVRQRAQLFHSTVEMETMHARRQAEHHANEERLHDAKNALLAIDGATQTLERFRDRMNPEDRAMMTQGLTDEIHRLQRLIADGRDHTDQPVPTDMDELLQPVVTTERVRGLRVDYEETQGLSGVCRPSDMAEVVRALLDNARRHAPGSPVTVRAVEDGEWAVVYVEDRGRGIPRPEREKIFERGERRPDRDNGDAIDLFVSRRLMQDQGGDVWVEARPGGGTRFGVCVPRVDVPTPEQAPEPGPEPAGAEQHEHASTGGM